MFAGGQRVAHLVEAEHGHPGVVLDEAVDAFRLGEPGREIEERHEDRLFSLRYRVKAEGTRDMRLPHPGRADQDEIARLLQPVGGHELHELLPWQLRVEGPVEVGKEFHPFDPRHAQQVLPFLLFPQPVFLREEPDEEHPLFLGVALRVGQPLEVLPQLS